MDSNVLDFTAMPLGYEWDGQKNMTCPKCGKNAMPGRRGSKRTYIHQGEIVRGALYVKNYCEGPAVHYGTD